MNHLLVATSNPNKLREIRLLLDSVPVTLHSLAELPRVDEPDETGATFGENAFARERAAELGMTEREGPPDEPGAAAEGAHRFPGLARAVVLSGRRQAARTCD